MKKIGEVVSCRTTWRAVLGLMLCTKWVSVPIFAGPRELQDAFAGIAERAKPAVVNIRTVQQHVQVAPPEFFFGDPEDLFREFLQGPRGRRRAYSYQTQGTGSGVILDARGYVLTNEHVIREADAIQVVLTESGGKEASYPGRVIGRDPGLDLAVVKIQSSKSFPYLNLGDSSKVRVGDWAIAIGSPFALEQTLTVGVISAVRQSLRIEGRRYSNMIQTDAAINRGNSGGPLLNLDSDVIGINTAIFSPSGASAGIGFAIPSNEIARVFEDLVAGRAIRRGWLGIDTAPVDAVIQKRFGLPSEEGALVGSVFPGSPAEKAGLRRGDVIRKFDGAEVRTPFDLVSVAAKTPPGRKVSLEAYRDGRPRKVEIVLGDRPEWAERGAPSPRGSSGKRSGERPMKDEGPGPLVWEGVAFSEQGGGAFVENLSEPSPLQGYLAEGDIVRGVNQSPVQGLVELRLALKGARLKDGIVFDILRQGRPLYISVRKG